MARARQATNAQKDRWTGGGKPRKPPKDIKGTSRVRNPGVSKGMEVGRVGTNRSSTHSRSGKRVVAHSYARSRIGYRTSRFEHTYPSNKSARGASRMYRNKYGSKQVKPTDRKGTSLITHSNTSRRLKGTSMIPHSKTVRTGVKVSGALAVATGVGYAGYKIHQRRAANKNPTTTPKAGAQQPQKFGARVGRKR